MNANSDYTTIQAIQKPLRAAMYKSTIKFQ